MNEFVDLENIGVDMKIIQMLCLEVELCEK